MLRIKKDLYEKPRRRMVEEQLLPRGIKDKRVLEAMEKVPRHLFVDDAFHSQAYGDFPLPIGHDQTISQPYMVAYMSEALGLTGSERVMEIGTGSGYQCAVLALLAGRVYSVERVSLLADRARKILDKLLCSNVVIRVADGTLGWEAEAPFDAILVTAGAPGIPAAYTKQLAPGGRIVIPVGDEMVQELVRVTNTSEGLVRENLGGCRFVKLIGKDGWVVEGKNNAS